MGWAVSTAEGDLSRALTGLAESESWTWPEEAREQILAGLASPDPEIRLLAVELAAEEMDDEIAGLVMKRVADPEEREPLRARAAIVLGPALEECSVEEMVEQLPCDAPLSARCYERVRRGLRRVYHDGRTPKLVRRRVLEGAVRAPQAWQRGAVEAAMASGDEEWRATAVFCMGFLDGFETRLLEALGDPVQDVRFEAVRSVGRLGIPEAGSHVVRLARDAEVPLDLRLAAVDAVGQIRPPGARELLEALAASPVPDLAEAAEFALEDLAMWDYAELLDGEGEDPWEGGKE